MNTYVLTVGMLASHWRRKRTERDCNERNEPRTVDMEERAEYREEFALSGRYG